MFCLSAVKDVWAYISREQPLFTFGCLDVCFF